VKKADEQAPLRAVFLAAQAQSFQRLGISIHFAQIGRGKSKGGNPM